jgi:hypothetical protein
MGVLIAGLGWLSWVCQNLMAFKLFFMAGLSEPFDDFCNI